MKAERRHELKHNELADWLGETASNVKPHANGVIAGLAVLAAIVLGSIWYFSGEAASSSRAWSEYFDAFNTREPQKVLQTLANEHSSGKASWWAQLAVADMNLGEGASLLYSDRENAKKHLDSAKDAYLKVEASTDPMLKNRARLGLAKVHESLCEPAKALTYYQQVADSEKDSAIGKAAAADAKRMKDSREVAFLEWFVAQTPKRPAPLPGVGGNMPGLPSSLSDQPDFGMPKLGVDQFGAGSVAPASATFPAPGTGAPAAATESTATTDDKTSEAKPADAKPGDATPAESPKTATPVP
jgi:hypothetical protein